ncbi:hypothetical protein ACFVDU_17665 [Streptomyces albidoflavus]
MANLADTYGTDVEIFLWADDLVWADCRTGLPEPAHRVLRSCGFTAPADPGDPASYSLPSRLVGLDRQVASSAAASRLVDSGYRVAIDPALVPGFGDEDRDADARRLAAVRQVSAAASKAGTEATTPPAPEAPASPAPGVRRVPRSR